MNAISGILMGLDTAGECFALAALCFAGPLAAGLGFGTVVFLLATALAALIVSRFGRVPGAIATAQDASIAVLAATMAMAGAEALSRGGTEAALATAITVMALSTLLSGAGLYLLGRWRLARFARLLPFPVACGFLAASGLLLVIAAIELGLGDGLPAETGLRVLLPAAVLALALHFGTRRFRNPLAFILTLLLAVAGFWILHLALNGGEGGLTDRLVQTGELPVFGSGSTDSGLIGLHLLGHIDLSALLSASGGIAAVILLNLLGVVLNLSGVEVDQGQALDFDHELRVTGLANLAAGAIGGPAAYTDGPTTALVNGMGLYRREVGYGYALAALASCFLAGWLIPYVPMFVSAGLLLFIGAGMLIDWLWHVRRQIDRLEWLVLLAVVGAALLFDILAAIGIGILLSAVSFALAYGRTPLVRARWSGRQRRSIWDRAPAEEAWLAEKGDAIQGLSLQGHIYFGRVDALGNEARSLPWPEAETAPRQLILDFSGVSGLDGAACAAAERIFGELRAASVQIHLAGLNPAALRALARWNPDFAPHPGLMLHADLETAIEAAERQLLATAPEDLQGDPMAGLPVEFQRLAQPVSLAKGAALIEAGSAGRDVWLLLSGRLGVYTASGQRLRSLAPGGLVGEMALYTGGRRMAQVRADEHSRLLCLCAADLTRLEAEDPAAALRLHHWLAAGLAEKLVRANRRMG